MLSGQCASFMEIQKMKRAAIALTAIGLSALLTSVAIAQGRQGGQDITDRVQEMNETADRLRQERERREYQEYLRRNDDANGVSQREGVTGGRTSDGQGGWIGWQRRTD